jgi:hypothetical protein
LALFFFNTGANLFLLQDGGVNRSMLLLAAPVMARGIDYPVSSLSEKLKNGKTVQEFFPATAATTNGSKLAVWPYRISILDSINDHAQVSIIPQAQGELPFSISAWENWILARWAAKK